jgi:prepilin-type N-terminal cleavage/methylation domain-containing protein
MKSFPLFFLGKRRAFTLVETLMAVTVMGLAAVGIVAFMNQGLKMYYGDRARLMINRDIRSFTSQIDTDAVTANFFCLYPDFNTRTTVSGSITSDGSVADGQVGDFLVLIYTDPAQTGYGVSMITELVGYYREVTDTARNSGPVHRFDIKLSPSQYIDVRSAPMYTILGNLVTGTASSYPIVTQLAQGLATNTSGTAVTPALFYNFKNRSVMIDTQISESLTERGTTSRTGNTYNFTVSPRG